MCRISLLLRIALCGLLAGPFAAGQTEFISDSFFPADMEFGELLAITEETILDPVSGLAALENGALLEEAGMVGFARRRYTVEGGSALTIEIYTFEDNRGPFSLLSLMSETSITEGPPGEFLATSVDALMFARGMHWVRLQGGGPGLMRRVATSVSNRIGSPPQGLPQLITHLPQSGYDPASLRYVLGPGAQTAFTHTIGGKHPQFPAPVEIAQGWYEVGGDSGLLTLVSFPTPQMAEDYFDSGTAFDAPQGRNDSQIYLRRVGPIVAILEGSFDPDKADIILEPLEFTYSIQWIYDKNKRTGRIVWGVPVAILGTVVRSLLFVVLLGVSSVIGGVVIAAFRIAMRTYWPRSFRKRAEYEELIKLKINEN